MMKLKPTPLEILLDGNTWPAHIDPASMDWAKAWWDVGPSPAGNPGPYMHVPYPKDGTVHRVYFARAQGSDSALREALELILPMAMGYAKANPVGNNAAFVAQAHTALSTSPLPDTGWLPISTAPKDGTQIIVWGSTGGTPKAHIAEWKPTHTKNPVYDGFRVRVTLSSYTRIRGARYWRTLPPAPATAQAANDNQKESKVA